MKFQRVFLSFLFLILGAAFSNMALSTPGEFRSAYLYVDSFQTYEMNKRQLIPITVKKYTDLKSIKVYASDIRNGFDTSQKNPPGIQFEVVELDHYEELVYLPVTVSQEGAYEIQIVVEYETTGYLDFRTNTTKGFIRNSFGIFAFEGKFATGSEYLRAMKTMATKNIWQDNRKNLNESDSVDFNNELRRILMYWHEKNKKIKSNPKNIQGIKKNDHLIFNVQWPIDTILTKEILSML